MSNPDGVPVQIRAEIERISFRNADNGWTVARARNTEDQEQITIVGFFADFQAGEHFELFGSYGRHPQYGPQFKVERLVPIRPTTKDAISRYLSSGIIDGIGQKTAAKIVRSHGTNTFDILDNDPEKLLKIKGITGKTYAKIIKSWQEQKNTSEMMMFLNQHQISPAFSMRIIKFYGTNAIKIISADPFKLAHDIQGIGFISADRIARSMGVAADSPERIRAAIVYQMQQAEDKGHCFLTSAQLLKALEVCLEIPVENITPYFAEATAQLNRQRSLVSEPSPIPSESPEQIHYRADLLVAECQVAYRISELLTIPLHTQKERVESWLKRYSEASGTTLSEEQINAVRNAIEHRMFILTGGPGVGKTTTANTIIRLLIAMGKTVALGAPTGRAAQRLTEVAATPARTIHRMLEWNPAAHTFIKNEHNPLTAQVIIIDEASMLDIRLAEALLRAISRTSQLILIGDVDQLPSVGPGNVLRDLIQSEKVPYSRLTTIFRQAAKSRIVQTAHAINSGVNTQLTDDPTSDCHFIEAATIDEVKTVINDLITRHIPQKYTLDSTTQVQVLTPMNRGDLGTVTLSSELQQLLNPLKPGVFEYKRGSLILRPGDKVIQSVNNYELNVFNGDIGFVRQTKVEGGKLIVAFGDRLITYDETTASDLRLAYAITIHKAQGSEFPAVIIPCTMQFFIMLQRNLIYTALTRAKKVAFFVGSRRALAQAIGNTASLGRQTNLIPRIQQHCAPNKDPNKDIM